MSVFDPDVPVLPTPRLYSSRRPGRYRTRMTRAEFLALRAAGKELPGLGNIELISSVGILDREVPLPADGSGGTPSGGRWESLGPFPRLCEPGEGPWDCYPEGEAARGSKPPCCLDAREPKDSADPGPEGERPDVDDYEPFDPRNGGDPENPTESAAPRLAINLVSFYVVEDPVDDEGLFDDPVDLVDDIIGLDAAVIRQPGLLNLFLPHIYNVSGANASVRMRAITMGDFEAPILRAQIQGCEAWAHLKQVVRTIRDRGGRQKLLITFISFGGGSGSAWDGDEPKYMPDGEESVDLERSEPKNGAQANPIFVPWSTELDGSFVKDPVTDTRVSFDVGEGDWRRYTLDPHNGVKRIYFRRLSRALGQALQKLAADLDDEGIDLSDYLEGIEIGNEMEIRHTLTDRADPAGWATFYYYCATAIRASCDWVPLYLPGLASYALYEDRKQQHSWDGKLGFLRDMLRELDSLRVAGLAKGLDFRLDELVDGIDYHFYHNAATDEERIAVPLHFLAKEVESLKDELAPWLPNALLSVCESGVNVLCSYDEERAGSTCEASPLPGAATLASWRPAGVTDPLVFQASSVFTRLSIALASGAGLAGWHSHVALAGDYFRAMGLHFDQLTLSEAKLSELGFRPAWWSFQRLAQVVKGATAVNRLAPEVLLERDTLKGEGGLPAPSFVWVIEIPSATWPDEGGVTADSSGLWTAYLLFIEPGGPGWPPPTRATVRLRPTITGFPGIGGVGRRPIYRLPTVPTGVVNGVTDENRFPLPSWSSDPVTTVPSSGLSPFGPHWEIELRADSPPVLLFSSRRLTVRATDIEVEE